MTLKDICTMSGVSLRELQGGNACISLSGELIDRLPENLNLLGLTLENCPLLECLPDSLRVRYLSIQDCPRLRALQRNLDLTHLYVFDSNIEAIPECSYAIELVLIECPKLRKLPDSCHSFERDLCLEGCTALAELPAIKKVGGNLNITRTSIKNLPEGIRIGKTLYASGSKLEALPENIQVGEDVFLDDCRELRHLPDGFMVKGNLDLSGSGISQWPQNLVIKGKLNIQRSNLQS